jgi:hypothetical protein
MGERDRRRRTSNPLRTRVAEHLPTETTARTTVVPFEADLEAAQGRAAGEGRLRTNPELATRSLVLTKQLMSGRSVHQFAKFHPDSRSRQCISTWGCSLDLQSSAPEKTNPGLGPGFVEVENPGHSVPFRLTLMPLTGARREVRLPSLAEHQQRFRMVATHPTGPRLQTCTRSDFLSRPRQWRP